MPSEENVACSPAAFLQVTVVTAVVPWEMCESVTCDDVLVVVGVWGWRSAKPAAVPVGN